MATLAIRNNNPGNLRPSTPPWIGVVGENGGFVVFDTMEHGIRALAKNLIGYYDRTAGQGEAQIDTVAEAIARWAPGNENNTEAYIAFVCSVLGCEPTDKFDFHSRDFLYWMVTAIGEEEAGHDEFLHNVTDAQIQDGINMALGG